MQGLRYPLLSLLSTLLLLHHVKSQFVKLSVMFQQIDEGCWVLDTNNLTQIGMGNCQNQIYYVNLGLGTPAQFYNFQIDTFRDYIWFPFNQSFVQSSQTCQVTNKSAVTLLHKSVCQGFVGSDIVTVNQTNISTRSEVVWANNSQNLSMHSYIDGILGLANSPTPNFLDNAALNNQINSSVFSLQMGGFGQPSVLYYNQLPPFIEDQTIYVPVIGPQLWQVQVYNVKVNGFEFENIASKKMIIDTSSSIFYMNPSLYGKIYDKYFNSDCRLEQNGKSSCICNYANFPSIQIILYDVLISIQPTQYLRRSGQQCQLLIGQTLNQQSPMLMGSSLMKNYIITFDKESKLIGFNGQTYGVQNKIFIITQLVMLALIILAVGVGVYMIMTIRFLKQEKRERKQAKQVKQGKTKKLKQKLIQLSTQFLDQP